MITIAICDDSIPSTAEIEKLIYQCEKNNKFEIDVYFSGEELLKFTKQGKCYDLLYLDVEMGNINGIDVGHEIRKTDKNIVIIYITSHINFAPSAFEVKAFRFLTKPIDAKRFEKYYLLAMKEIIQVPCYFRYTFNRENFQVAIEDIMYFESKKRITLIVTKDSVEKIRNADFESKKRTTQIATEDSVEKMCYIKLNDVEADLIKSNVYFYRISQSFLINPNFVYSYVYDHMHLNNDTMFPIASNRREKVRSLFCKIKGG